MCSKQCRDDNGFKCHTLSESHQRQMAIFAENPDRFLDVFSETFEEAFLELLSRRYNTRRIAANQVYNEFIQDKEHVHMNSTIWPTLSDFVKYLGRTGKAVIDESERGWNITWIDRDPAALARAAARAAGKASELDEAAAAERALEEHAAAARAAALAELFADSDGEGGGEGGAGGGEGSAAPPGARAFTGLERAEGAAPLRMALGAGGPRAGAPGAGALGAGGPRAAAPGAGGAGGALAEAPGGGAPAAPAAKRPRWDVEESGERPSPAAGPAGGGGGAALAGAPGPPASAAARLMEEDLRLRSRLAGGVGVGGGVGASSAGASAAGVGGGAAGRGPSRFDAPPAARGLSGGAVSGASLAPAPRTLRMPAAADCWVVAGLTVRVMAARLAGGAFVRRKGTILRCAAAEAPHVALVRCAPGGSPPAPGATLKVDQLELQTVLPAPGGTVLLLRGPRRGALARLLRIDEARFAAALQLLMPGGQPGETIEGVEYEDICKWEEPGDPSQGEPR